MHILIVNCYSFEEVIEEKMQCRINLNLFEYDI